MRFTILILALSIGFFLEKSAWSEESLLGIETHAFLSQGFIKTTDNNYLVKSKKGSFNFTEVGINFTKPLMDDLRAGFQLFARNLGSTGDFSAKFDWFYLDYHWSDYLGIRFGRVKLPFGLYNDSSDFDSARVPVLLPQSLYPIQNRDYLLAQSGAELYGYSGKGFLGGLNYRLYGGTIPFTTSYIPGSAIQLKDVNVPYIVGGRVLWDTPLDGLRVGGSFQALKIDTVSVLGVSTTNITADVPATLWVGSVEYTLEDLLLSVEYSRWYVKITNSSNKTIFPEINTVSERGYAMASYRFTKWFQPGAYFSLIHPNVDNQSGRENYQQDYAATLRFDINRYWLVKLEGHYMRGTSSLSASLNDNTSISNLTENWGMFLIKTTGYF